jgi:hypothetical protein
MSKVSLRRYTNLAATLDVLQKRRLTLLSPSTWDDRNDAFFMSAFKARTNARSVLALCFAEASETYHHWRVFSHGSDGVCIELDKEALIGSLGGDKRIRYGTVTYKMINDVSAGGVETKDLPFLKRYPYRDEKEFRLLYIDMEEIKEFHYVPISLQNIVRVTLSPWMPKPLSDTVVETLRGLEDCGGLAIYRSTLIENERWKRVANPDLKET